MGCQSYKYWKKETLHKLNFGMTASQISVFTTDLQTAEILNIQ